MNSARALKKIRELARNWHYSILGHAEEAMVERDVSPADLHCALTRCAACWFEPDRKRWKAVGPDALGEELFVIVEIHDDLLVVTMFRGEG